MKDLKLFIMIGILVFIMIKMCKKSSTFGNMKNKFSASSNSFSPDDTKVENITPDTILIFHATWCGHCKKSMNEFKKATSQGRGKIMLIDSDEYPELVKKYGVRNVSDILNFANE